MVDDTLLAKTSSRTTSSERETLLSFATGFLGFVPSNVLEVPPLLNEFKLVSALPDNAPKVS